MKKIIALSLILVVIWSVFPHWPDTKTTPDWPQNQTSIVFSISGEVLRSEKNLLAIRTEENASYFFDPSPAQIVGEAPHTGEQVTLRYAGRLQKDRTLQSVTLLSIEAHPASVPPPPPPVTPVVPEAPAFPAAWDDKGIFSAWYPKAYEKLQSMSLEERAGQVFLARCPPANQQQLIESCRPGGLILFAPDFSGKTKGQVQANLASYQKASPIPLFLAVDEEGGTVIRVSQNANLADAPFLSPQALFRAGGMSAIYQDAAAKSRLLMSLGLNVNLAPVCDVSVNSGDYIYSRTFGKAAQDTAGYVSAVVRSMEQQNFSCVLKHFPGYGNNADTHTGVAVDARSFDTFQKEDFLPFKAGIEAGATAVLVAHTIVTSMDSQMPASLSLPVHRILREDLSFTGVIMTDDLTMDAIAKYVKEKSPALAALKAGNDLIIVTDLQKAYQSVLTAVGDGSLPEEVLNRAAFRVLAWKYQKGILK